MPGRTLAVCPTPVLHFCTSALPGGHRQEELSRSSCRGLAPPDRAPVAESRLTPVCRRVPSRSVADRGRRGESEAPVRCM